MNGVSQLYLIKRFGLGYLLIGYPVDGTLTSKYLCETHWLVACTICIYGPFRGEINSIIFVQSYFHAHWQTYVMLGVVY